MLDAKPSKSALKRADQDLKRLGEALIALKPSDLDALPLDERLKDAVLAAKGMRAHGALRRQRQLIAKLLRQSEADAIVRALDRLQGDSLAAKRRFRRAEAWRDRLVAEGADVVDECVEATGVDEASLCALLGDLSPSRSERSIKTARRELFRIVHAALETAEGIERE